MATESTMESLLQSLVSLITAEVTIVHQAVAHCGFISICMDTPP